MDFFEKAFDALSLASEKVSVGGYTIFAIVALSLIVALGIAFAICYAFTPAAKIKTACKKISKYLNSIHGVIDDENVGDFTKHCFSDKAPRRLREAWIQYLGVRFGYPSEVVSKEKVFDREVKSEKNVYGVIFLSAALLISAVLCFFAAGEDFKTRLGVVACVGLLLSALIHLALVLIGRGQFKSAVKAFENMQDDLDAKVNLQIEKDYSTDASPLLELAAIVDEIVAKNTSKDVYEGIYEGPEAESKDIVAETESAAEATVEGRDVRTLRDVRLASDARPLREINTEEPDALGRTPIEQLAETSENNVGFAPVEYAPSEVLQDDEYDVARQQPFVGSTADGEESDVEQSQTNAFATVQQQHIDRQVLDAEIEPDDEGSTPQAVGAQIVDEDEQAEIYNQTEVYAQSDDNQYAQSDDNQYAQSDDKQYAQSDDDADANDAVSTSGRRRGASRIDVDEELSAEPSTDLGAPPSFATGKKDGAESDNLQSEDGFDSEPIVPAKPYVFSKDFSIADIGAALRTPTRNNKHKKELDKQIIQEDEDMFGRKKVSDQPSSAPLNEDLNEETTPTVDETLSENVAPEIRMSEQPVEAKSPELGFDYSTPSAVVAAAPPKADEETEAVSAPQPQAVAEESAVELEDYDDMADEADDDEDFTPPRLAKLPQLVNYMLSNNLSRSMKIKMAMLLLQAFKIFQNNPEDKAIVLNCISKLLMALKSN